MITSRSTKRALALAMAIGTAAAVAQSGPSPGGGSQPAQGRTATPAHGAGGVADMMLYRGVVRSVDPQARSMVIEGADGGHATLRVDAAVDNLPRIRSGDPVSARYTEAVARAIVQNADTAIRVYVEADGPDWPPGIPGSGDVDAHRETVVANVIDIDHDAGRVLLLPTGRAALRLRVPDPALLAGLERGDQVIATYVPPTAVSIEPEGTGQPGR